MGYFVIERDAVNEDQLMEIALESGADDLSTTDPTAFVLYSQPAYFEAVRIALARAEILTILARVGLIPLSYVKPDERTTERVLRLIAMLDDQDDVQNVISNLDAYRSIAHNDETHYEWQRRGRVTVDMYNLEIVSLVVKTIELLAKAPKLAGIISRAGINMGRLLSARNTTVATDTPLDAIIEGEQKRLRRLIDEYNEIDDDEKYGELEKDKYRLMLAARACALLRAVDPVKDRIPEYEKLIAMFCSSIPASLKAA